MRIPYISPMGTPGGVGEVDSLPGCAQIAVLHAAHMSPQMRGAGLGDAAHAGRVDIVFNKLLYDAAICTTVADNVAQNKILRNNGWRNVGLFKSSSSGHTVLIWLLTKE